MIYGQPLTLGGSSEPELLWENASPTSAFSPQTVSISGGSYEAYIVEIRSSTSSESVAKSFIYKDHSTKQIIGLTGTAVENTAQNPTVTRRIVGDVTDTTIEFENGMSTSANTNLAIPTRIWGVKFTL